MKLPNAVPKPKTRKRAPKGLKRTTRMRQRNAKRQGSAFPKQRDAAYCAWIRSLSCIGFMATFRRVACAYDAPWRDFVTGIRYDAVTHYCWGKIDPAHVGKHRSQGAPDRGAVVPMCRGLHTFYDEHRADFAKVTGWTEAKLAAHAAVLAHGYVERGGSGDPNP